MPRQAVEWVASPFAGWWWCRCIALHLPLSASPEDPLPLPPPPPLQTPSGANVSTLVYDVSWPLSQISLSSGQQYFITVQGSNEAGGWVGLHSPRDAWTAVCGRLCLRLILCQRPIAAASSASCTGLQLGTMLSSQAVTADSTPPYLPAGASVYSGQAWADQATQVGWGRGHAGRMGRVMWGGRAGWRWEACRPMALPPSSPPPHARPLLQSGTSALEASWDPFVDDETGVQCYSYQASTCPHCTAPRCSPAFA